MKKNLKIISIMLTTVSLAAITGCAHTAMRGSVAMKGDNGEAHVCMGDKEVKAGDKVFLFKSVCTAARGGGKGGPSGFCEKVKVGEGTVERTLNEHYSLVKVDPGVAYEEGTIVEKE